MSLKKKLNRLKHHMTTEEKKQDIQTLKEEPQQTVNVPFLNKWEEHGAKPYFLDGSFSLVREVTYPINHQHGLYCFSDLFDVSKQWESSNMEHPLSNKENSVSDMIFFDTETTGLGGGTGNTIFVIGYARVSRDNVTVTQHILPSPASEIPMYQAFLADVGESMQLACSYNGKAFDWPQIKTRHTLIRNEVPKLPAFGHFDLLHASRRLWKDTLPNVRLSIVEKEILNIKRENDVPGYLAPMIYFDFLKDPNPEGMIGILTHNEIDVLTLITLYIHISKLLLDEELTLHSPNESYQVARWFHSIGDIKKAEILYTKLVNTNLKESHSAKRELGYLYKKQKRYTEAVDIWTMYIQESKSSDEEVLIELSKIYEHHIKKLERAIYYADEALKHWKNKQRIVRQSNKPFDDFQKRIDRLQNKLNIRSE